MGNRFTKHKYMLIKHDNSKELNKMLQTINKIRITVDKNPIYNIKKIYTINTILNNLEKNINFCLTNKDEDLYLEIFTLIHTLEKIL